MFVAVFWIFLFNIRLCSIAVWKIYITYKFLITRLFQESCIVYTTSKTLIYKQPLKCYLKRCSYKSRIYHTKKPVLESLFDKAASLKPATLLKRDSSASIFLWILRNSKNSFFQRTHLVATSVKRKLETEIGNLLPTTYI